MQARPRIDLEGVALADEKNPYTVVAIFRHRTTDGLVLLIPESADVLVEWKHVREAALDLANGRLKLAFDEDWAATQNWLRSSRVLVGRWLDRFTMKAKG